jgi:hypothetical protein
MMTMHAGANSYCNIYVRGTRGPSKPKPVMYILFDMK